MAHDVRIAIDVGGTFTDVVKLTPATGEMRFEKVPTTPDAPTRGVMNGFSKAETNPADVAMFNHGTTLGLNSLLTRTGARIAVISTFGFRDVYLLGRTDRRAMYDITFTKPPALLARKDTFEVRERSYFDGRIAMPFDEDDARRVAKQIACGGYEAVAVAFLHSYANPSHELRMLEVLFEEAPDVEVTLSHQLSREYREYERTSTAVLDAYIKPIVRNYLTKLQDGLDHDGFTGQFLMSRSGGGAMTAEAASQQPVNLILSGPAGGVIGAAALSKLINSPNLITIDMGGTSLDASLILDNEPVMYQGAEFEGMPINTPSLYIHTIGAGGGSIAWTDEAGALQVGPQSAGARPGPAAYGRGGVQPTFTDAALVLGYMGTDSPLGGDITLNRENATASMSVIAAELGLGATELARGIIRISTTKIVGAVRAITVELGRDPKDFALLSFGGGGGLVAIDVARELGIATVIVPPGQGAFSALGMLMADVQHDFARTSVVSLSDVDADFFLDAFSSMEEESAAVLTTEGFDSEKQRVHRTVDVRYAGQEHSATVPFPDGTNDVIAAITKDFAVMHERLFGHVMDDDIEITTVRLRAVGLVDKPELPLYQARASGEPTGYGHRTIYAFADEGRSYNLITRESLMAGDVIVGPAVISEHTATTVMHEGDRLAVGSYGELVITIDYSKEA